MDIGREYLSEGEVAQFTGRALSSLRNDRANRRGIPFIRWGRRFIRYKKADVLGFMEERRVETEDSHHTGRDSWEDGAK